MDELSRFFEAAGQGDQLGTVEVLLALGLSLACTSAIALVYRYTHRAADYQQSYVTSLVLMGLVTTLIMIVIGSNIARAFSLVGALSIVRFRNAVKETRDVAFIYFVMAIAMAAGTRFYVVAVLATLVIIAVLLAMHFSNFGASTRTRERMLMVQFRGGLDPEQLLQPALDELFTKHAGRVDGEHAPGHVHGGGALGGAQAGGHGSPCARGDLPAQREPEDPLRERHQHR